MNLLKYTMLATALLLAMLVGDASALAQEYGSTAPPGMMIITTNSAPEEVTTTNKGGGNGGGGVGGCPLFLAVRSKVPKQQVGPGGKVKISFTLRNRGASAVEAAVTVRLPFDVTLKKAGPGRFGRPQFDPSANLLTWASVRVKPGSAVPFSLTVTTDPTCIPAAPLLFLIRAVAPQLQACAVEATASLTVTTKTKRAWPTCPPTTAFPTPAPTVACVPGQFRNASGACQPCAPGTFWNETTQTTACLTCPVGETSLESATRCFVPCAPNQALNTTDLTCVPIPQAALDELSNLGIDPSTVDAFVVEEQNALQDTIGYLYELPAGSVVVIELGPGVFPVGLPPADLDVDLIIVGGGRRRRRLGLEEELEGTSKGAV